MNTYSSGQPADSERVGDACYLCGFGHQRKGHWQQAYLKQTQRLRRIASQENDYSRPSKKGRRIFWEFHLLSRVRILYIKIHRYELNCTSYFGARKAGASKCYVHCRARECSSIVFTMSMNMELMKHPQCNAKLIQPAVITCQRHVVSRK